MVNTVNETVRNLLDFIRNKKKKKKKKRILTASYKKTIWS